MDRNCARMAVLVVVSRPKDDACEEQGGDSLAEDLEQLTVETGTNTEASNRHGGEMIGAQACNIVSAHFCCYRCSRKGAAA